MGKTINSTDWGILVQNFSERDQSSDCNSLTEQRKWFIDLQG